MQLYKFSRGPEIALTRDQSGKNLPEGGKGWTLMKSISAHTADDAARAGLSYQDVTRGVADKGYYICPSASGA